MALARHVLNILIRKPMPKDSQHACQILVTSIKSWELMANAQIAKNSLIQILSRELVFQTHVRKAKHWALMADALEIDKINI